MIYPAFFWTQLVFDIDDNAGKWHYMKTTDENHAETICGHSISTKLVDHDIFSSINGKRQKIGVSDGIACPDCLPKFKKLKEKYAAKNKQSGI